MKCFSSGKMVVLNTVNSTKYHQNMPKNTILSKIQLTKVSLIRCENVSSLHVLKKTENIDLIFLVKIIDTRTTLTKVQAKFLIINIQHFSLYGINIYVKISHWLFVITKYFFKTEINSALIIVWDRLPSRLFLSSYNMHSQWHCILFILHLESFVV